jgi:predicted DNA-binding antitoxin AbrB/MazE fold protein
LNGAEEIAGHEIGRWAFNYAHMFPSAARQKSATITVMKETLRAVFENGVFRPLTRPKGIAERREVTLTVTTEERPSSLVDFAGRISSDDAQEMREIIEREFERVDPGEWR